MIVLLLVIFAACFIYLRTNMNEVERRLYKLEQKFNSEEDTVEPQETNRDNVHNTPQEQVNDLPPEDIQQTEIEDLPQVKPEIAPEPKENNFNCAKLEPYIAEQTEEVVEEVLEPVQEVEVETPLCTEEKVDVEPTPNIFNKAWNYLLSGNILAKVGILILFFASAFLLKYVVHTVHTPVWLRFLATGCLGLGLAGVGYLLRNRRPLFAKIIAGGGLGITYMTIYASFQFEHILPNSFALALMLIVVALSVAGSLMLDSFVLATMSTLGGLLAPVLIYPHGSIIALFSYYFVLNIGVLLLATRRNWYYLNILCFVFTYGASALWHALFYHAAELYTVEVLLNILLALYIVMALVITIRHQGSQKRSVSTIIFGAPLITLLMQTSLLHLAHHNLAVFCFVYSVVYAALFTALHKKENLRTMSDSCSILALTFLSLVFVIALNSYNTAVVWAIESCAVLWAGFRHNRLSTLIIGMLLGFLSYFCLLLHAIGLDQVFLSWLHEYQQPVSTHSFILTALICSIIGLGSYIQLVRKQRFISIANLMLVVNCITWVIAGICAADYFQHGRDLFLVVALLNIIFVEYLLLTIYKQLNKLESSNLIVALTTFIIPACMILLQSNILFKHSYILAIVCIVYAIGYGALSFYLRENNNSKNLPQAFFIMAISCVAISVLCLFNQFGTIIAWSLEATLVIWYARKQAMPNLLTVAIILQALTFALLGLTALDVQNFYVINHLGGYLFHGQQLNMINENTYSKSIIITSYCCSILGLISSLQLVNKDNFALGRNILLILSLICWFAVGEYTLNWLYPSADPATISHHMLYAIFTFAALWFIGERRNYKLLNYISLLLLPCVIFFCILLSGSDPHWSIATGILALVVWYGILYRAKELNIFFDLTVAMHLISLIVLLVFPIESIGILISVNKNVMAITCWYCLEWFYCKYGNYI